MYLITGGAGFIGSHLASHLLETGARVRVLDDFSTGKLENLAPLQHAFGSKLQIVSGSILDAHAVERAMTDVRFVMHQAAKVSVVDSWNRPTETLRVNVEGTSIVLESARRAKVAGFVLASSAAVYGDDPAQPKVETQRPSTLSPYAVSKLAAEHLVECAWRSHNFPAVALRYFNVYGPRQDPDSPYAAAIPRFIAKLRRGEPPEIFGDGEQTRDFIFVADVAKANWLAVRAVEVGWGPFNIALGRSISVNELVATLQRLMQTRITPVYLPPRLGDIRQSVANVTAARLQLGFRAATSLTEGLRLTVGTV